VGVGSGSGVGVGSGSGVGVGSGSGVGVGSGSGLGSGVGSGVGSGEGVGSGITSESMVTLYLEFMLAAINISFLSLSKTVYIVLKKASPIMNLFPLSK
jgi:hypothetical protein